MNKHKRAILIFITTYIVVGLYLILVNSALAMYVGGAMVAAGGYGIETLLRIMEEE